MKLRLVAALSCLLALAMAGCDGGRSVTGKNATPLKPLSADHTEYAGSESCAECHRQAYDEWKGSHHANAQRNMDPAIDDAPFDPRKIIRHASQTSSAEKIDGRWVLTTAGPDGKDQPFVPTMALGVFPLWQYIIPWGDGRYQLTELAWDPARKEWFNVYGNEDRKSGEWGHWTGRGMNWNSMCATCHTTAFRKNYDPISDKYASTHVEQGVGCEACHGPLRKHVDFQRAHPDGGYFGDRTVRRFTPDEYLSMCGACHSRRDDLTGRFMPGDSYFDHYEPSLPDLGNTFHADGQILDEDFEYNVFMLSYMHDAGVRCNQCHSPHTSKIRKPSTELCLECHRSSMNGRIPIDPAAHGFHPLDKGGSQCIDCHYPQTPYMQRHWRHDHGMTIPDPQITKEFGIPNACNRCHADKSVDWAIEWTDKWYGPRMNRPTGDRARAMARLKRNDLGAVPDVISLLQNSKNGAWRAVCIRMLSAVLTECPDAAVRDTVRRAIIERLDDGSAAVQAAAIEALEPFGEMLADRFRPLLRSPFRLVRVRAAWVLRHEVDLHTPVGQELSQFLAFSLDQPTGAFRWANYLTDTGKPQEAVTWYAKAVRWDPFSAPFRHQYAVALQQLGRSEEALAQLTEAAKLAPREGLYEHSIGLLLNEAGRLPESRDALARAVQLEPRQPRFWYNLGLAESHLGNTQAALAALEKAEQLDPTVADYPFARATVYVGLNQREQAEAAARQVLRIDPNHAAARQILQGAPAPAQ